MLYKPGQDFQRIGIRLLLSKPLAEKFRLEEREIYIRTAAGKLVEIINAVLSKLIPLAIRTRLPKLCLWALGRGYK